MTTVKNVLRLVATLALVAAIAVCLPSCKGDGDSDTLSRLEALKNASALDEVSCYRVIIPSSASSKLAEKAEELALAVTEYSKIDCGVIYDNVDMPKSDGDFDILVGNTNRRESSAALDGFLRDDYICKMTDSCVILGALSDSAAIKVVERFIDEVLPTCEGSAIMDHESNFEYRHDYEIDRLVLCGFELFDYDIVCSFGRGSSEALAVYKLRELVADRCGAYPDVQFGSSPRDGVKELVFSIDGDKNGFAEIGHDGEDVTVSAADCYGLSVGLENFYSRLFENVSDGRASLDVTYSMSFPYFLPKLELSTVLTDMPENGDVISVGMEIARSVPASADAVLFGKTDKALWELIRSNLESGFTVKSAELDGDTVIALAYKQTALTCGELSVEDIGGVRVALMELTFVADGQSFSLYSYIEEQTDKRNDGTASLKSRLDAPEARAIAVYMCSDNSPLELMGEGITTCQNASVTFGARMARVGVFVSGNALDCQWKGSEEIANGNILRLNAQKRFCDAFIVLG